MLQLRHEGAHERLLARLGAVCFAQESDRRLRVHVGERALNALVCVGVVGAAPCFLALGFLMRGEVGEVQRVLSVGLVSLRP